MHVYRLIVMYPSTYDKNISTTKNPQKWLKKSAIDEKKKDAFSLFDIL